MELDGELVITTVVMEMDQLSQLENKLTMEITFYWLLNIQPVHQKIHTDFLSMNLFPLGKKHLKLGDHGYVPQLGQLFNKSRKEFHKTVQEVILMPCRLDHQPVYHITNLKKMQFTVLEKLCLLIGKHQHLMEVNFSQESHTE